MKLPVWLFMDGPLKGLSGRYQGKCVEARVRDYTGPKAYCCLLYEPDDYHGSGNTLTILARLLPHHRVLWKRIERQAEHG